MMRDNFISSRTPEGVPGRCPICHNEVSVTPSDPFADAPCPACGVLLWPLPRADGSTFLFYGEQFDVEMRRLLAECVERVESGSADSLDRIEMVMEIEDALDISIPDDVAEKWRTFDDFLNWFHEREGRDAA